MKNREEHQIPLSDQAVEILNKLKGTKYNEFIFFSPKAKTGHISPDSMLQLLSRMNRRYEITPHGMRRTLREWCGKNGYPFEVAESALSHKIGNKVVQAYVGDVYLDHRREMLQAFADFAYKESKIG